MRYVLVLCAVLLLASCDDEEAFYADGSRWEPIVPQLLKNDSLIKHPYLRRMPTTEQEWTRFIQTLNAQPVANIGTVVETFQPTNWSGFSVDPVGTISYFDFGEIVFMWRGDNLLGTSDATDMSFDGVPENLWPVTPRSFRCVLVNNTTNMAGLATISSAGLVSFSLENVSGSNIIFNNIGFTAAADKGIPQGWFMVYSQIL